eukprot:symbB.v1.2.007919.t1/scaffold495.1/size259991/3
MLEDAQRQQLMTKQLPGRAELGLFRNGPWEIIRLQDILFCEPSLHGFFLHVDHTLGHDVTLEVVPVESMDESNNESPKSVKDDPSVQAWYKSFREKLKSARRKPAERPNTRVKEKLNSFVMEWITWLQFPVKSLAGATIPDMDCPDTQHLFPLAFLMSMVWLGVLSSLVVNACDGIHRDFDIPTNVLGFTVAAAGTSFPNVFSGMCVARQGKAGMAVANALGANVQNVFLALAIPWTIQAVFLEPTGEFQLVINGFAPAIIEIFITLLPLVLIYFCCSSLPKWSGAVFLVTYVIYIVCALKQESSGCVLWPEKWEIITIDDHIPCQAGPYEGRGECCPYFSRPKNNELYVMLLEKAFAKFCGGYSALEGGWTIWAIRAMTGDPAREFKQQWMGEKKISDTWQRQDLRNIDDPKDKRRCGFYGQKEEYDNDTMFEIIRKYHSLGSVLSCSGTKGNDGLVSGHAYSILQVRKVNDGFLGIGGKDHKMIQIRNPWGTGEWKGDWSDKSDLWEKNPAVKKALQYEDRDDGAFWMSWSDFVENWARIGVVDRTVDINGMRLHVKDDSDLAPVFACCRGCGYFWCCCQGCKKVYCPHRSSDKTVKVNKSCCLIL